ncbi:MAG: hypothetical protein ABI702_19685 [Burkholderiales bacterium]
MREIRIPLNVNLARMLLADWFIRLGREAGMPFEQYGAGGETFMIGAANAFHVKAQFIPGDPFLKFTCSDAAQQSQIDSIATAAVRRCTAGDLGDIVWHSAPCATRDFQLTTLGALVERISNQTRITGWRRLGRSVLLEFSEEVPPGWDPLAALFAPKTVIGIHVATRAPCAGHFSSHHAHVAVEIAAAICTFALGRYVSLPSVPFPSRPERLVELAQRQVDPAVGTLARKSYSLDIFADFTWPGTIDHFQRLRAAFLTFDAAIRQEHDSVACILYVVVAECLTTLATSWRGNKLTTRFVRFFDELMPAELDQLVAHNNFEAVFGIRRGTRTSKPLRLEMLAKIYDYRSGHLHSGLRPAYHGFAAFDGSDSMRRALFADFAEGAILRYLESPRASLIGHPNLEPVGANPCNVGVPDAQADPP